MNIYERDNSNEPKKEGSGCFPYCFIGMGAAIYELGCRNEYHLFECLVGKTIMFFGALALINDNSSKIKKGLEKIGESVMTNFYSLEIQQGLGEVRKGIMADHYLLKRKLSRTRELNSDSLDFSYTHR